MLVDKPYLIYHKKGMTQRKSWSAMEASDAGSGLCDYDIFPPEWRIQYHNYIIVYSNYGFSDFKSTQISNPLIWIFW